MITATYVNATTFTVSGDQTAEFHVGRRVKHVGDTTGYGTIESVSVPVADTQVVLTAASDNLDASLSGVYYGIVSSYEPESSVPIHTHDGDEGSGGDIFASPTFTGQATIPTVNLMGGQIAFPVTAVPSADPNTLDDYEEGGWTPVPADAGSGGNTGSAGTATANYTKAGRIVSLSELFVQNISTSGLTAGNDFFLQGVPFAFVTSFPCGAVITDAAFTGSPALISGGTGATALRIAENVSGVGIDYVIVSEITTGATDLRGSIMYTI